MSNSFSVSTGLKRIFAISAVLTVAWMIMMGSYIKPLNSKQIVSFELARTTEAASQIINEWKEQGLMNNAKKSIYLDFVFLILYSVSIAMGCLVVSAFTENRTLIQMGSLFYKIVPLAGCCDIIENLAMLKTLSGEISVWSVTLAFWFASIKFLIVALSLLFVISCLIMTGIKKMF